MHTSMQLTPVHLLGVQNKGLISAYRYCISRLTVTSCDKTLSNTNVTQLNGNNRYIRNRKRANEVITVTQLNGNYKQIYSRQEKCKKDNLAARRCLTTTFGNSPTIYRFNSPHHCVTGLCGCCSDCPHTVHSFLMHSCKKNPLYFSPYWRLGLYFHL